LARCKEKTLDTVNNGEPKGESSGVRKQEKEFFSLNSAAGKGWCRRKGRGKGGGTFQIVKRYDAEKAMFTGKKPGALGGEFYPDHLKKKTLEG